MLEGIDQAPAHLPRVGARDHLPVGERHHRYLLDARVGHLRSPRTPVDAHLVERQRDLPRGADGARLAWLEAVYNVDGRRRSSRLGLA